MLTETGLFEFCVQGYSCTKNNSQPPKKIPGNLRLSPRGDCRSRERSAWAEPTEGRRKERFFAIFRAQLTENQAVGQEDTLPERTTPTPEPPAVEGGHSQEVTMIVGGTAQQFIGKRKKQNTVCVPILPTFP